MKSLALVKRVLLATVGVMAFLGVARPAAAVGVTLKYFYVITPPPIWANGNPQAAGWTALTALGGSVLTTPFAAEDYVSLSLPASYGGSFWFAYDTFLGESNGFIGADVSVPTAQWLAPAAYYWTGGPAGGGALAFFNSFNPFTGVFFANEMIVLDPPSCDAITCLSDLEGELGSSSGLLTPSLVTLDGNGDPQGITIPDDDEDASLPPDPNGINTFADGTAETPEGPTGIYVMLGVFVIGAGVFLRRRRPLLSAARYGAL
jgi:hypothetical protein